MTPGPHRARGYSPGAGWASSLLRIAGSGRIRERPAYTQLREQIGKIDELKAQF